jgi:hypothetical protein
MGEGEVTGGGIQPTFGSLVPFALLEKVSLRVEHIVARIGPDKSLEDFLPNTIQHLHLAGCRKKNADLVIKQVANLVHARTFADLRHILLTLSVVKRGGTSRETAPSFVSQFTELELLCSEHGLKLELALGPFPHELEDDKQG